MGSTVYQGRSGRAGDLVRDAARVQTVADLAALLRRLRRRHARRHQTRQVSIRQLAQQTGYAAGLISEYLAGKALPPTDRFDVLVQLLGAEPAELGALATARDRAEEARRHTGRPDRPVPRELPPAAAGFTGRASALATLDKLVPPAVALITGTAGVGKTALAVHWADQAQASFPDGCLYLDLRGYAPNGPVPVADALAALLGGLGVPAAELPPGEAERAARYRTLLAGRQLLVLLDNAGHTDQVRPLIPGGAGCVTLVTSRDTLTGLVACHGAERIRLAPLPADESVALLAELLGDRVAAEPAAAATLAERCAGLPLPLRLAGQLAQARPDERLATLAAELADTRHRLARLDEAAADEPETACRAAFSWSYRNLPEPTARAFRLIGDYPGYDLDAYGLAALAGADLAAAQGWLRDLARAHLVAAVRPGRYGMHDLLRGYAAEQAATDPEPDRAGALARLRQLHHYLCATAVSQVTPPSPPPVTPPAPDLPLPSLAGRAAAAAWLDAERANLVATAVAGADPAGVDHAAALATLLRAYLDFGGHHQDVTLLCRSAAAAPDPETSGDAMVSLSVAAWRQHRHQDAARYGERGLALGRVAGAPVVQARALTQLATVYWQLGWPEDALACGNRAVRLYQDLADTVGQARVLGNIGNILKQLDRVDEAARYGQRALELFRSVGDLPGQAVQLSNQGAVLEELGRLPEARGCLSEGLAAARACGHRMAELAILDTLALVHNGLGQLAEATEYHEQAVALAQQVGDRSAEGFSLTRYGSTRQAGGELADALDHHHRALRLARRVGDSHLAAEARNRLGGTLLAAGRLRRARRAYQQAYVQATAAGDPRQQRLARVGIASAQRVAGTSAGPAELAGSLAGPGGRGLPRRASPMAGD